MAKTKSFAEKMLKGMKPKDETIRFQVVRPKVSAKGSIRWDSKIVKVKKGEDEAKTLGI